MSDWCLETPSCSRPENRIPSGRQLLRTPPMADVKKQLNFCDEDFKAANCTPHADPNPSPAFGGSFTETAALDSMLKGMKGYQLTSSDLEFIKKMKEQQLVKKLQADLEAAQKLLKKETMLLELAYASRKMALDELDKFPSCEVLTEWAKLVLRNKACLMELDGLDVKSLLAVTTMDDVQSFMMEKKKEIDEIKRRAAEKRKKDKEKREELEKQVACEELKIQELMRQLADLKSDLSQQEEEVYKSVEVLKEPQAPKSKVKRQGRERKVKFSENTQEAAIDGNSTRRKPTNEIRSKQKSARDVSEARAEEKSAAASESRPSRSARGKLKDVQEGEASGEAGRRRPAGASRAKTQETATSAAPASHGGRKAAAEEAPTLRRSKRIANKKRRF